MKHTVTLILQIADGHSREVGKNIYDTVWSGISGMNSKQTHRDVKFRNFKTERKRAGASEREVTTSKWWAAPLMLCFQLVQVRMKWLQLFWEEGNNVFDEPGICELQMVSWNFKEGHFALLLQLSNADSIIYVQRGFFQKLYLLVLTRLVKTKPFTLLQLLLVLVIWRWRTSRNVKEHNTARVSSCVTSSFYCERTTLRTWCGVWSGVTRSVRLTVRLLWLLLVVSGAYLWLNHCIVAKHHQH